MKYCKVVAFVDGEAVVEPEVPLFCLPFLRWVARMLGASISVSSAHEPATRQEE